MNSAAATDKCVQAVDELFTTSGGGAIFLANRINQYWRDIHAARAHYANNPLKSARNYGGVMLGLKTTDFFL
jgi:3-hydroxy-9,10-secoandrosta-1,3,5(10)-triene-9,17-dione monooxygenase